MLPGIKFLIFTGILILSVFICLTNFWWLIAVGIIALIVLIMLTASFEQVRTFLGWLGFQVGNDNNYRLAALGALSLVFFILAFKYGAGEPLFLSTWRETSEIIQSSDTYKKNKDDMQSFKNRLLHGLSKNDKELEREKAYIKRKYKKSTPKEKISNEAPEIYNQKIRNYRVYGVFVNDSTMQDLLKSIPSDFQVASETEGSRRTWIFWKLGFMFFFLFLLYLPFALSDEVVDLLEKLKEFIVRKREEYRVKVVPPVAPAAPATTTATIPSTGVGATQKWGWFAKLYTSDMAAEFSIKFIEGLIKLLSRQ